MNMTNRIAHDFNAKWRSADVRINKEINFSSLSLDETIVAGLTKAGYIIPSPVQLEAIPLCLTGKDVFVQGKAGTGKTLVFSILALVKALENEDLQVLILAPTREGAIQIYDTINAIGSEIEDFKCECFIGGLCLNDDLLKITECRIAVGTPGRIWHLMSDGILRPDTIRLFVIDDVDELLDKHMKPEVNGIFSNLPRRTQTVVTSLTSTDEVLSLASMYLNDPYLARYCDRTLPPLLGMAQYYHLVPIAYLKSLEYRRKLEILKDILFKVKFSQCIIFCNSVHRVDILTIDVRHCGLSVASFTKAMDQVKRLQALELLKKNKCKVFVSSDVGSRCLDAEHVDLVINFDIPSDTRDYLHRCGRAGRYGGKCSSVTFITKIEKGLLIEMESEQNLKIRALPDPLPEDLNCDVNKEYGASQPHKLPSSWCYTKENIVPSLTELSKNAIMNPEKTEVDKNGEGCSLFNANKTEEQIANFEIVDASPFIPEMTNLEDKFGEDREVTAKIKAKEEILSPNQLNLGFGDTEALNKEYDSESNEESAYTPCKTKKKLIVSSVERTGRKCSSFEEIDLFSTSKTVPKNALKFKPVSKTSKDLYEPLKTFDEMHLKRKENCRKKVKKISQLTGKNIGDMCNKISSKSVDHCKSQSKSHESRVMCHGLETICSGSPANHSGKKAICQKHKIRSNCRKHLDGCSNHSHCSYFNVQGNSFPDKKLCANGHFNCCSSRPFCPSSQHCCSFLNHSNYQSTLQMQNDIFYQQWKFINDFSYYVSYLPKW